MRIIATFKLDDGTKMQVIGDCANRAELRNMAINYSQRIFNERKFVLTQKTEVADYENWGKSHNSKNMNGEKMFSIAVIYRGQVDIKKISASGHKTAYNNYRFMCGIEDEVFAFIYDTSQVPVKKSALAVSKSVMSDRNKTNELLQQAYAAMRKIPGVDKYAEDLTLLFNMLKDYQMGIYKQVPANLVTRAVIILLYFVSPINLSFEVIPVIGQLDDIMLIGWLVNGLHDDLQAYKEFLIKNNRL